MSSVRNESEILENNFDIKDLDLEFSDYAVNSKRRSKRFIDIALSVIGLGFDIYSTVKGVQDDAELEQNFNKAFEKLNKNYDAIKTNYRAIQNVEAKVDRITDTILKINQETQTFLKEIRSEMRGSFQQVLRNIKELQTILEEMMLEMRASFQNVLHTLRELQMGDKISSLTIFIEYFWTTIDALDGFSPNMRVTQLERSGGILDQITKAIKPDGILRINLNHIINLRVDFPKNFNNNLELRTHDVLYYGIQTYISVFYVVLQEYTFLADFYYQRNNIDICNEYFDRIILDVAEMKTSLLGSDEHNGLIEKVRSRISELGESSLGQRDKTFYNSLQQRNEALKQARKSILETSPSIMADQPQVITRKPNFTKSRLQTPLGDWKDDAKVSYAMQFVRNDTYSKIGEWSEPIAISGKASPSLRVPIDTKRRTRVIYRKFDDGKPQFVGAIEDSYQTHFTDINRDLYNAAKNLDENKAMEEIQVLIENGADANAAFEGGRKAIHAAAQAGNVNLARKFLLANNATNVDINDENGFTAMHIASAIGYEDFVDMLIDHKANICAVDLEQQTPLYVAAFNGHDQVLKVFMNRTYHCDINSKDRQGLSPIHAAVFGGLPALNTLLSNKLVDLNVKSNAGLTPLHLAVLNEYDDIVGALLENQKLDINAMAEGRFTALHFAAIGGSTDMIRLLCSKPKTDVNAASMYGWTPLHFAIELKKEQAVLQLLACNGVKVNAKAEGNVTPLHLAANSGQKKMILALLENGGDIEAEAKTKYRAIHFAAMRGHKNALATLIEHKANKEARTDDNLTPLMLAASSKTSNTDVLKYLIEKAANKEAHNDRYENFIFLTAKSNNLEMVKYVIENYDALHVKTLKGNTYFHVAVYYAAVNKSLDIVKYLVEHGADINVQDSDGDTALHQAAMANEIEIVKFIIEKGANINARDREGYAPLHKVAYKDSIVMVKFLVEHGANVNASGDNKSTPLHYAALFNALKTAKYLIEKGANVNIKDNRGLTPIHMAAIEENYEMVKLLMKMGADINSKNNDGTTALHAAAYNQNLKTVKFLLENGANIQVTNENNSTPLHMAVQKNAIEIVKYLIENGADFKVKDKYGYTPLNDAAFNNAFESVKYLVEKGANIHDVTNIGSTPLHKAAENNAIKIVRYLREQGADVNRKNRLNHTPLHEAAENNALETVKYLVENGADLNVKTVLGKTPLELSTNNNVKTYLRPRRSIRDLHSLKSELFTESPFPIGMPSLKTDRNFNQNEINILESTTTISKDVQPSFKELSYTKEDQYNRAAQHFDSNIFFTAENLAFIGCIVETLDKSASKRYHRLRSQGVNTIPNVNAAVHDARERFHEFVEERIATLGQEVQTRIREELDKADSDIVESLMRGVEFSGIVGLDHVLKECEQCFEHNLFKKFN